MSKIDPIIESELRARALNREPDASTVLADYYEQHGQRSRADLWRTRAVKATAKFGVLPPDQLYNRSRASSVDPRRDTAIWLAYFTLTADPNADWPACSDRALKEISGAFKLSKGRVIEILKRIFRAANLSSQLALHDTRDAAIYRLRLAGAIPAKEIVRWVPAPEKVSP